MRKFKLTGLDHIALRVADMEKSAQWYERVLGLKRYDVPEWNGVPIFMLAGKTGIALFPANPNDPLKPISSNNAGLDHFAFNVSNEDFDLAKEFYDKEKMDYDVQDHTYFMSMYTKDPDGHTVELTTLVGGSDFY